VKDLWTALGLVLVIEGALYALFPHRMIELMRQIPELPPAALRAAGILAVALGWLVVWFARH